MKQFYSLPGRVTKRLVAASLHGWRVELDQPPQGAAVLLVHHQNLSGPIHAMALLPFHVRLWALHVFSDRKSCFDQYYGYTFTRRFGWPRPLAFCAAGLLSLAVPGFLRWFQVIPVYRGSLKLKDTFRLSGQALAQGQPVLICPDRDYSSRDAQVGQLYEGFLQLDQPYFRATGQRLPFYPVYCSAVGRVLLVGRPVLVEGAGKEARHQAAAKLEAAMNDLGARYGDVSP